MTLSSARTRWNPIDWLQSRGVECPHITFDPNVVPEYRIVRGSRHDGTLVFTYETIARVLAPLVEQHSYFRPTYPADSSRIVSIRYTVGHLRIATVHGKVEIAGGCYPGCRERVTLPVRCEYVLREPGWQLGHTFPPATGSPPQQ